MSCLVYLPRDRYTTAVRLDMEEILREAFDGTTVDYTARVSESVLARLHFVVRVAARRAAAGGRRRSARGPARRGDPRLVRRLRRRAGRPVRRGARRRSCSGATPTAFPEGYKEEFPARTAVADVRQIESLERGRRRWR